MAPKRRRESVDAKSAARQDSSQPYQPNARQALSPGNANTQPSQRHAPKQPRMSYDAYPSHAAYGSSQNDPILIDDDDDEEDASQEVPDASQGYNEVESSYGLYGEMVTKIVGCRYYTGYATVGEIVMARREPENPYDSSFFE